MALPDDVSVSILQRRDDYGPRHLQIEVTNDSADPVTVLSAELVDPHFTSSAPWTRETEVPAGTARDLEIALGEPVCDPDDGPPAVLLAFRDGAGRTGEVTVESPDDPFDTIAKVAALDCLDERAAEVATFDLGDELTVEQRDGRPVAVLELTATPTGADGVVTVDRVDRTILVRPFSLEASWPLGWTLEAAAGIRRTELDLLPSNCNPHIVAEDKRGTFFPVQVTLDDGTTGPVYVGVGDALRGEIYAYIADYCGW